MKGKVPRRVPRKFPFVRHRHDAFVVKMTPLGIASVLTFLWRRWKSGITLEPLLHDVMIKLFVPKHPCQRLALDCAMFFAQTVGRERRIKFFSLVLAFCKQSIEVCKGPQ